MRRQQKGQYAPLNDIPVILDLGHYALKGIVGDDERRRDCLRHGLLEMSRDDWQNIVDAGGHRHPDYIRVANSYYEVGQTALNHSSAPTVEGTARYQRNYYGVLMCTMIARLFDPGEIQSAVVFASYPPGDRRHKDELERALLGVWDFEHVGRNYNVVVRRVVTYAEPMGGFWNFVIQEDANGQHDNPDYNPKRQTLVIDLGGGTMSMLPIGNDQLPDFRNAYSFPMGFNNVAEWFERELRANYRDLFRGARQLPDDLVHESLATGRWYGGGDDEGMDVSREVESAMAELIEQFRYAYNRLNGPQPFGQIILTGGGSAILGKRLAALSGHKRVFYAHNDLDNLHYANVTGGLKAFREIFGEVMP